MNKQDFNRFSDAWADAHEAMAAGKVLSPRAMVSIFDDFEDYSIDAVLAALKHHRKTARFAPVATDIIELLEAGNKRLTADEAWAMMPDVGGMETVVWTDEMADAYDTVYDLLVDGDKIAARMAFKSAYERLCAESVMMQRPVTWKISKGDDQSKIEPAVKKAVLAGRITQYTANQALLTSELTGQVALGVLSQEEAIKLLPSPNNSGAIAGLITGKLTEAPPDSNEHSKEKWKGVVKAIDDIGVRLAHKERQRVIDREQKRLDFEAGRQDILNRVAERLQAQAK